MTFIDFWQQYPSAPQKEGKGMSEPKYGWKYGDKLVGTPAEPQGDAPSSYYVTYPVHVLEDRERAAEQRATRAALEAAANNIPTELLGEICVDVMVGTYGITGSLTKAKMDVENRISKWLRALSAPAPTPSEEER